MAHRDASLVRTFVELADTLVADFDLVELLSLLAVRCTELFDVAEAGVLLADADGKLYVAGSSSHDMRRLEVLELQHDDGPCPDSFRTATIVTCDDLEVAQDRWPSFTPAALATGFRSAHAIPMRLRGTVIGALNLLSRRPGHLTEEDGTNAQALADVATIAILQQRAAAESQILNAQLRHALDSRIIIEQAKGFVGHQRDVDMNEAFNLVRGYARSHQRRLADVAAAIVAGTISSSDL